VIFGKLAKLPRRQRALPGDGLRRIAAVAVLRHLAVESLEQLVGNANLISKVYFPRLVVPASSVVVAWSTSSIFVLPVGLTMAWYRFLPTGRCLLLPFFVLLALLASLGPGLWITALNVKYRDFRYIIPFIVQFGLYVSPVGFRARWCPSSGGFSIRSSTRWSG
jgi:lipopolysaccharide transport system permease protein